MDLGISLLLGNVLMAIFLYIVVILIVHINNGSFQSSVGN